VLLVRLPDDLFRASSDALRRAVARVIWAIRAIELHQHGVIDIRSERLFNGLQLCLVAVGGQLHARCEAGR
jgi:hypothetical protein